MKTPYKKLKSIISIILSLLIMLPNFAYAAENQTVSLQVQQKRNIEIALALGDSNLDVSGFENDIKAKLSNTYGISNDRVKVTAVKTAAVDAKNQFDWEIYDHYYDPSYPKDGSVPSSWSSNLPYFYYSEDYPADYTLFFNDVNETDNSLKNCYNRSKHIYPKGSDIYFVGYSSPAFKDFMLYPESQGGKKTIEFTIEESKIDTHTLEGAGFLFNTGMTTDSYGVQRLNGYLVLYDYASAYPTGSYWAGKTIKLYHLNNVDASKLHQEGDYRIDSLAYQSNSGISLLASKNSQSTSETLNIKIESMNTGFKLFEDGNTIYDTTGADSSITISDTGAYGFGPFVSYGSHGCPSLTYFTYKNIKMTNETVKSFLDVIREPEWQENTKKFIVNLDDNGVVDFQDGQKLSEILYRMINQDIHYIGWGKNGTVPNVTPTLTNQDQANAFIVNNNGKGLFIDQDKATNSYQEGIAAIAEYINNNVQTPDSKYILLDEPYSIVINPSDLKGTWRIEHDPTVYKTNQGSMSWDNQVLTTFPSSFDKNGKYAVFYNDGTSEQKVADITAAWRPVASLAYTPANKTLSDKSYDPNGMELTREWKWKNVLASTWVDGQPNLAAFDQTNSYLVQLRVQNSDGVWSLPSTVYLTNDPNALPIAAFTLPTNKLIGSTIIVPINTSYSPNGILLDEYKWEVFDSNNNLVLNYSTENPTINFANLPKGIYSIKLSVRAGVNWSQVFSQSIDVIASTITTPPIINSIDSSINSNKQCEVRLEWGKVTGASGYEVYRDSSLNGSFNQKVYSGNLTYCTDPALFQLSTYYYKVRAVNDVMVGPFSEVKSILTCNNPDSDVFDSTGYNLDSLVPSGEFKIFTGTQYSFTGKIAATNPSNLIQIVNLEVWNANKQTSDNTTYRRPDLNVNQYDLTSIKQTFPLEGQYAEPGKYKVLIWVKSDEYGPRVVGCFYINVVSPMLENPAPDVKLYDNNVYAGIHIDEKVKEYNLGEYPKVSILFSDGIKEIQYDKYLTSSPAKYNPSGNAFEIYIPVTWLQKEFANTINNGKEISVGFRVNGFDNKAYYRDNKILIPKANNSKALIDWPLDKTFNFVSSMFGSRNLGYGSTNHKGIDIGDSNGNKVNGQPVLAAGDGEIIAAHLETGSGRTIAIKHNDTYTTKYRHLSGYAVTGGKVKKGDVIGYVGGSDTLSNGTVADYPESPYRPHLHFEVWKNGARIDPEEYLKDEGVIKSYTTVNQDLGKDHNDKQSVITFNETNNENEIPIADLQPSQKIIAFTTQWESKRYYWYDSNNDECGQNGDYTIGIGYQITNNETFLGVLNDATKQTILNQIQLAKEGTVTPIDERPKITEQQVQDLFKPELDSSAAAVKKFLVKWQIPTLTQNEFDALVSWTYNCGVDYWDHKPGPGIAFNLGYMLIQRDHGEYQDRVTDQKVIDAFTLYIKAGDQWLPGLYARRMDEAGIFLGKNDYVAHNGKAWGYYEKPDWWLTRNLNGWYTLEE